jgi:Family of unknown function (DUF5681)
MDAGSKATLSRFVDCYKRAPRSRGVRRAGLPDTANFSCKRFSCDSAPHGKRSYNIGYGKPPVKTRWKPGGSGNPKGRPRGARNRLSPLMLSLDQLVRIMRSPSKRASAFARIAAAKIVLALAQGEPIAMPRMRIR